MVNTFQLNNVVAGSFAGMNALLGADTDSTGYVSEEGRNHLRRKRFRVHEQKRTGKTGCAGAEENEGCGCGIELRRSGSAA